MQKLFRWCIKRGQRKVKELLKEVESETTLKRN